MDRMHSVPASQGRIAGYRIGNGQSAGLGANLNCSKSCLSRRRAATPRPLRPPKRKKWPRSQTSRRCLVYFLSRDAPSLQERDPVMTWTTDSTGHPALHNSRYAVVLSCIYVPAWGAVREQRTTRANASYRDRRRKRGATDRVWGNGLNDA